MKKNTSFLISLLLISGILFPSISCFGQGGFENFANFPETTSQYNSGTFEGQDGSIWEYVNARGDAAAHIDAPTPGLQNNTTAKIESGTLTGGIEELRFDYKQMFTTNVELNVYVNDNLVATVTSNNQSGEVLSSGIINIDGVSGDFFLRFQNNGGQVAVDNVDWFVDTGDPILSVDPGSLNFSYLESEGPSESQAFTLTGDNLNGSDVTITAPDNFEISEDNNNFLDIITLTAYNGTETGIYTRLKSGLAVGEYSGNITVEGGDAASMSVALSGKVVEQFAIPYSNPFKTQEDNDIAEAQGFVIDNASNEAGAGGYLRIFPDGYVQTPTIDFTQYDYLIVEFNATTYGGDQGQTLSIMVSADDGVGYDVLQSYTITGNYVTYDLTIDLTDTYNSTDGKIKIEMTAGGASTRFRDFSMIEHVAPAVATPTFNPGGGIFYEPVDVIIESETEGATIYYSTNSDDPETGTWTEFTTALNVTETTTFWAYAHKDGQNSETASETYMFPIEVSDIEALRAGETDGTVYKLTGEAILTYQQNYQNKKWIQDANAGIEIFDGDGIITTGYNINDGITGITGTLSRNNNMLQLTPVDDPGPSTSQDLTPATVTKTLNELGEADQARLITIESTVFDAQYDGTVFNTGTNYEISDPSGTGTFRTEFWEAEYINDPIPMSAQHITAIVREFNGNMQITARSWADFVPEDPGAPNIELSTSSLYDFGNVYIGNKSNVQFYYVYGSGLTENIEITVPGNFKISTDCYDGFQQSITLTHSGGIVSQTRIYVRFFPITTGNSSENITHSSADATTKNVSVSGSGVESQIPANYYQTATGTEGELMNQLHNIIKNHTTSSYSALWSHFENTDQKYNSKVWDIYSDIQCEEPPYEYTFFDDQDTGTGGTHENDVYNREHSWPRAWWGGGTSDADTMNTDMFHIYPADKFVNAQRDNYLFGMVDSPNWTSMAGHKLGPISHDPGITAFEPIDEYKGDFARTFFYMVTRYKSRVAGWASNNNVEHMLDGSSYPAFEPWALEMLMVWHENDPVSQKETDRNNAIYNIQGNRNPFIDEPGYVNLIWGEDLFVATPTFSPNGGTFYSPVDVTIETETEGATIYYSTDSDNPGSGTWTEFTTDITLTETTTIWAYASKDGDNSELASASFILPVEVSNIETLRTGLTDGTIYKLTGEAVLTYQQSFQNKKWIQDNNAGIEIFDNDGIITTGYNIYDGITGITGTLDRHNNMLQLTPVTDPGPSTSQENTPVIVTRSLTELSEADQARLIKVEGTAFDAQYDGTAFSTGTNYEISDPFGTGIFRTEFGEAEYINDPIPMSAQLITAIVREFNGNMQITARSWADFTLMGDVNGDSAINVLDIVYMVNHINGENIEGFVEEAADLNNDGEINVSDLAILIDMIFHRDK